jgi:NADH-quinone oxidoreductase subunit K
MNIQHFVSIALFSVGLIGLLVRRGALFVLMSLALLLHGATLGVGVMAAQPGQEGSGTFAGLLYLALFAMHIVLGCVCLVSYIQQSRTAGSTQPGRKG